MNPLNLAWPALNKSQTVYDNATPAPAGGYTYSMQLYGTGNFMDCSSDPTNPKVCWLNPNGPGGDINLSYRGLRTTTRVWHAETNSWIESHVQYDQFGNAVKAKDPIGNETTTEFSAVNKYAYPTKVIAPAPEPTNTTGTDQASTVETTYDFATGLPLTVKDDFGQITRTEYDNMLRPVRVFGENFTAPESQTVYGVPNASGQLPADQRFVKVRKQIDANNWDEATTWFDGLGRTTKTQAKDSQGDVFVDTVYDNLGRVERVTNPYRAGDTIYWSKTRYDASGRAVESYAPATIGDLNANNLTSLGVTSFDISNVTSFVGTVVTTTDASGRKGRSITNALGQLLRVDEPTAVGGTADADLGAITTPNQPTIYSYDLYGKMVRVQQGVQNRYFKYDSLGRLIRVSQPEQEFNPALDMSDSYNPTWHWTAGFTYDILGNVLTATDANGVTITNTYDRANRVKTRTYTMPAGQPATPSVSFFYDGKGLTQQQTPNYAKGKLTRVTSSVSETQYQLFDNFGRLTQSAQITDGQTYTSSYQYNLSGALVEETYPSGRKVSNEFESDGDLLNVTSRKTGSTVYVPYASNFSYTASGGISQMRLGNGKWETAKFNTRLQVTELGLGASASDAGLWKVNYDYGELITDGTTVNVAKNTGNIAKQTLTIPGTSFVQAYRYDPLYRLTEAKETTGTNQNWIQNWTYDRYGNRLTFSQNIMGTVTATTPAINANTNRFVTAATNFQYDLNGNLVRDAESRQFTFNGDNKQTQVRDGANNVIGQYFYDGEGKRVKKLSNTETTIFVYSAGKLIAEYSTQLSQNPSINYTTTDHLGSPRIITDQLGQVKSRRDFMPFGEDLFNGIGARSENLQYGTNADDLRQRFTGYLKDNETNLDFAEARMYENRHGRFTAVDPLLASGKSASPQSFNRYVYVRNNPLILTDPTGLDPWWKGNCSNGRCEYRESATRPEGEGWSEIDFSNNWYHLVPEWNDTGRTRYLYQGGGDDFGTRFNVVQNLSAGASAFADTGIGVGQFGWNSMAFVSNSFYRALEQPSPFAGSWDPSMIIHRTPYWEATNQTQANAQLAMTAISLVWGGAASGTRAATMTGGSAFRGAGSPTAVVGSGNAYSVAFETRLATSSFPGLARANHFQEANRNLFNAMRTDSQFNRQMNTLIPGLERNLIQANGQFSSRSPTNWTWHHAQEPGVMQLVPRIQHQAPGPLQNLFHPNRQGGFRIWGQ